MLPLLAEAAPEVFLRAVAQGVAERSEPLLAQMFLDREHRDAFSVSSPHTGLLWALESVAWSEEHAPLAIKLLARLAEIDPGGRLSNRPSGSLADIFRTWLPQTSLPPARRLAVLDGLRRDHDDVAWKLMLTLLPENHAVGNYTHSPRFRTWKPEKEGVSGVEYSEVSSAVAQRLIEDVAQNPARWLELMERLADFPPPEQASALEQLSELARSTMLDAGLREQLWNELDKLVRTHRTFADAEWALPSERIDRIADVAALFAPTDPVAAHSWLFDEHWPDLGSERLDYHEEEQRIHAARSTAVSEVMAAQGVDGLFRLARAVEYPGFVGVAAASHGPSELDERIVSLLDDEDAKLVSLATGYSYQRVKAGDLGWLRQQAEQLVGSQLAQARLLQTSDELAEVWQLAADLGTEVQEAYWREFSPMGRGPDFALVNQAARSLMRFGRPITAIDLMNLYVRKEDRRVQADLVVEALEQFVRLPADPHEARRVSSYELRELLNYVRDSDIDEERLAVLEWQLLPALGYDARSPILERRLAREPQFFVELVSLVYKRRGAETSEDVREHVARNAYRLLAQWRIIPGSTKQAGEVNGEALFSWTDEARQLLAGADRREIGDLEIGKVLAHARGDEDGTWPTKPVRDVIERLASAEIEEGFQVQTYNNRGSTSRGVFDGGDQERALAARYNELAAPIRDQWPRTAAVLSELAKSYERDARRIDDEVERRREGMDD